MLFRSDYSWFIGCGLGFAAFWYLERVRPIITDLDRDVEFARDGKSPHADLGGLATEAAITDAETGEVTAAP